MPFNPKYTNTDKILNNLMNIASARELIEQACLSPELEEKFRRWALLRSTHASTALVGASLVLSRSKLCMSKERKN